MLLSHLPLYLLQSHYLVRKVKHAHLTLSSMVNLSGSTCVLHESEYFVFIAYNAIKEGC